MPWGSGAFDEPRELAARIPSDFRIGVATSAFQIEGSLQHGGRGSSVWDDFSKRWGTIVDEASPLVATDHLVRYAADVELLRDLGVRDYRFSVSWPRVQPDGRGQASRAGLSFYDRLLDALLEAGIRPMVTMHHWDTPSALAGGWLNRDTALRFGDYAHLLGQEFGDRVDSWVTLDEPATVTIQGYALGTHAPGAARLFGALPAAHHQLLAHGIGVEALRAADVRGRIGIVNVHSPVQPASDREADTVMADLFDVIHNRVFADPILLGRYPTAPEGFEVLLGDLATVDPADLTTIAAPLDFYGVDYRGPSRVAAGGAPRADDGTSTPASSLPFHLEPWPDFPTTGAGAPNAPEFLAATLAELRDRYADALPPVVLTALGASYPDEIDDVSGEVVDIRRIRYLAEHIASALAAVAPGGAADGVDLEGIDVWTLVDGFEWSAGYTQKYGLVALDAQTYERVPKESYRWLRRVLDARS